MSGRSNPVGGYGAGAHVPDSPLGAGLAEETQKRDAANQKAQQIFQTSSGRRSPAIKSELSTSESSDDESNPKELLKLRQLREELRAAGFTFEDWKWNQVKQAGVGLLPIGKEHAWNLKIAEIALKYRNLKLFERMAPSLDPEDLQQLEVDLEAFLKIIRSVAPN
ncbi:MAG TPA: hypothetical protein VLE89_05885 [Chlamydiales bacterium]|nr:hypothetical protein [Chlamydiales bacterium]